MIKRKASEIDKSKIEKNRGGDKGGFVSLQSMGPGSGIHDVSISSSGGFRGGSKFGSNTDMDSFSTNSRASRPTAPANAPPKGRGMQLGKTKGANQFLASLKAEGEEIIEDVQPIANRSKPAAPSPTDPVTVVVEEKVNVTLKRGGGVSSFDVQGTLSLQVLEEKDAYIRLEVESGGNPGTIFNTHPKISKELFNNDNILSLKDPSGAFPTGRQGEGVALLRWRIDRLDASLVPLTINCWPSVSGNQTDVSIEYDAPGMKNCLACLANDSRELLHKDSIRAIRFSDSGNFLVSAGDDKLVKIWCSKSWKCILSVNSEKRVTAVAISKGEKFVCYADKFGVVWVIDLKGLDENQALPDLKPVPILGHYCSIITSLDFSPDGRFLVSADRDFKIRVSVFPENPLRGAHEIQSFCLGHSETFDVVFGGVQPRYNSFGGPRT